MDGGVQLNALGDFFGRITGSGKPTVTETASQPLSGYPSQDDAREALKYGFGYGSGNEPYVEARAARVMGWQDRTGNFRAQSAAGMLLDRAVEAVDDEHLAKSLDLDKMENWKLKEKLGTTFTQAALAANRNPIALIGFDPSRTVMDLVMEGANVGGAYSKKKDAIYANIDAIDPSSVLHESIHRGLNRLRENSPEAKELLRDLPEEATVRYMMYKYAGDPEGKGGTIDSKQRQSGIDLYSGAAAWDGRRQKKLERLMEIAANMRKEQRPGGPR